MFSPNRELFTKQKLEPSVPVRRAVFFAWKASPQLLTMHKQVALISESKCKPCGEWMLCSFLHGHSMQNSQSPRTRMMTTAVQVSSQFYFPHPSSTSHPGGAEILAMGTDRLTQPAVPTPPQIHFDSSAWVTERQDEHRSVLRLLNSIIYDIGGIHVFIIFFVYILGNGASVSIPVRCRSDGNG